MTYRRNSLIVDEELCKAFIPLIKILQKTAPCQIIRKLLLDGTHLVAVRGFIHQEVPTSVSTSGARRSDAATSDKDKQICLSTLTRTGFDAEVYSYLAFHS